MAFGSSISHGSVSRLGRRFMKLLGQKAMHYKGHVSMKRRLFKKVSASAPTTTTNDKVNADDDIVIHYNTSGVAQGAYIATSASTPTYVHADA